MMKRMILVLSLAVIFLIPYYADAGPVRKGSILVSGGSSLDFLFSKSKSKYDDGDEYKYEDQSLDLDLTMGFFPGNNFELGFIIGQSYEKSKSKTSGSENKDTRFLIGPQLGGHIPLGNSVNLFINGALGFYFYEGEYKSGTSSIFDDEYDGTGFFAGFKFGAEFFINDYVAWDVGIKTLYTQIDYDEEGKDYDREYSETEFNPFMGIKVFLSR